LLMTDMAGADLTGANLSGANIESAVLRDTQVALTNFTEANLRNTDFTGSNWWRARGLTSDQILEFRKKFAPGKDSDESKQNDYRLWLKSLESENK